MTQIYYLGNGPGRPLHILLVLCRQYPPAARIRNRPLVKALGREAIVVRNAHYRLDIRARGKGNIVTLHLAILPQVIAHCREVHMTGIPGGDIENLVLKNGVALEDFPGMVARGIGHEAVAWTKVELQREDIQ